MSSNANFLNHLAKETSPYLLQHASNPVDWYPWNEEALSLAKQLDKPILLSIGYSACHWCHVMAHESFEDEATASVMNQLFINIKVDREERPDLDKIYQFAHQVLTQRGGGWPLTVILTPDDQTPFFAGTYFPKEPRHNMPTFVDVITKVASIYEQRKEDIDQQNSALLDVFTQVEESFKPTGVKLDSVPLDEARRQLASNYDDLYGGFGDAPKFPHPSNIERLFRHWALTKSSGEADTKALDMAVTTLRAMSMGGVFDQLGGGFFRYSVDQEWMIPHFEKMLYDNGPLLGLLSECWQVTGEPVFQRTALETGEWVMREMQSSQGGYYSTLDADSEGEEGRFYIWTPDAAKAFLNESEYAIFSQYYGLDRQPNFEGRWHLHIYEPLEQIAKNCNVDLHEAQELLFSARQSLFREREVRVKPGRDEKILTSWNGLMIKGMVIAGQIFNRKDFIASAESALNFVRDTLWQANRLLATYKDGKASLNAYLDDYVFLVAGILELLQVRWSAKDFQFAVDLMDIVLDQFEDKDNGGFYFTSADHERLIQRPKSLMDDAVASGYGVAVCNLVRLGHLLGEQRYLDAAEKAVDSAWENILRTPYAHNTLLDGIEELLYPPQTIVIRGNEQEMSEWQKRSLSRYVPRRYSLAIANDIDILPGSLNDRTASANGSNVAYICAGHQCQAPVTSLEAFMEKLSILE